jgi:predicted nucleic acid-binding protein
MNVLFDTNVILDLLLEREPFVRDAQALVSGVERGEIAGLLCATTVTTLHYLLCKSLGKTEAGKVIGTLLKLFEIAPVNRAVLEEALEADDRDYEDAVLYTSAHLAGTEVIVTRDRNGFGKAKVPVMLPKELTALLQSRYG